MGKSITIKFVGEIEHEQYIFVDGYKFVHQSTDTTQAISNVLTFDPEIIKLSIDQDSVVQLNSSFMYFPSKAGKWNKKPVTPGYMAILWIKAFNTITKNYRDDRYELIGTSNNVAMTRTVQLRSKDGNDIVIRKASDYPVVIVAQ